MADDRGDRDAVAAAADELYALDPDAFVGRRAELSAQARSRGDAATAKRIAALRKPTVAAWIVNRHVLADPADVQRLLELHDRLQEAQRELDAETLRELTTERRTVVDELTRAALRGAERADVPTSLRDDVVATFDAALADPEVAGRLGRLLRAEHWSGFGISDGDLPSGAPILRLVRGGRDRPDRTSAREPAARRKSPERGRAKAPATAGKRPDRAAQRAVRTARAALADADATVAAAASDEDAARERVGELADRVAQLQRQLTTARGELDAAKADVDSARRAARAARALRREAQSAVERAERRAGT